jgi:hypothetical protein
MSPRDMTADLRGYRGAGAGRYTRQEQRRQVIFENDPAQWKTGGVKWGASVARCPPNRAYRLCSDSERLIVIGTCRMAR